MTVTEPTMPAGATTFAKAGTAVVLVVEDDALTRLAIAQDLADSGCEVIEAANAAEALAVLEGGRAVDLVFSDIQMPGPMDGLALCRRVREHHPQVAIILTSASSAPRGAFAGSDPLFIPKPYLSSTVLAAVRGQMRARGGARAAG